MKFRRTCFLVFPLLLGLACQLSLPAGFNLASPILFQDDFSNPESGWSRLDTTRGATGYVNGAFRIYVAEANTQIWATPGLRFSDMRIEVYATKTAGADDNLLGVICRHIEGGGFYAFLISSDGYYGIAKFRENRMEMLGVESLKPTDFVLRGDASNLLRADCIGSGLSFYVNGEKLAEYQDVEFASGDVGLMAGAMDIPDTEIYFDNLTVQKP